MKTAHWEQGLVAFRALMDLKDEVHVLGDFERDLFHKAFAGRPGPSP